MVRNTSDSPGVVRSVGERGFMEHNTNRLHPVTDQADRIEVKYTCPSDHTFTRVFAADIKVPPQWDCPHCGKMATSDATSFASDQADAPRTHWDMVLERRTPEELRGMLSQHLTKLRSR